MIRDIRQVSWTGEEWISPGIIDLQVNGFAGFDVNSERVDADTIVRLSRVMAAGGVTTFLPTVITSSIDQILRALRAVRDARASDPLVAAMVPYVHVEGPHISSLDGARGAHPREHVRKPHTDELTLWQRESGGVVGMVTISPHWDGVESYIRTAVASGVHVALGHTHATAERIRAAVDAGARLSTHLGNGIAGLIARHENAIWPQLADRRLSATFIADGHHLPADALYSMIRAKGTRRSILVSDAVALAGMAPGEYQTPVGGAVVLGGNGRLGVKGGEGLAGAVVPLKDGVARCMKMAGVPLRIAIKMATENPGRFVGGRGRLRVGDRADLICFRLKEGDEVMEIAKVVIGGVEMDA